MTITPSEHAALTWAVDEAERANERNWWFTPPPELLHHIMEARRFLAREAPRGV